MNRKAKINRQIISTLSFGLLNLGILGTIIFLCIMFPIAGFSLLLSGYVFNTLFIIHQINQKRSHTLARISWIVLMAIPFVGGLIYLVGGYVPQNKKKHIQETLAYENELLSGKQELNELHHLFNLNFDKYKKPAINNTSIELIENGNNKFPQLFNDLLEAKTFINVEYFILNDGIIFNKLKQILIEKQKAGVKVRILTDFVGNAQVSNQSYQDLKDAGIEFEMFNNIITPFHTGYANYRNHNKFVIIDNRVAYFGGMNVGDDYSHMYSKYGYWNDLQFRVTGDLVDLLNKQFCVDWFRTTSKKIHEEFKKVTSKNENGTNFPLQVITDGPHYDQPTFLNNLITLINEAKKTIQIITPYFVIPLELEDALFKAKNRGVVIKIITAGRADKKSAYVCGKFYVEKLVGYGIEMYRAENMFIHSKMYLIDGQYSIVGTSNLDFRAIYLHFETNYLVDSKEFASDLNKYFFKTLEKSYLETHSYADWGVTKKTLFWLVKLISPMM